jgi:archaellin
MKSLKVTRENPQELRRFTETDIFPPEDDFEIHSNEKQRKFRKIREKDLAGGKNGSFERNGLKIEYGVTESLGINEEGISGVYEGNEKLFINIAEGHNDENLLSTNETQGTLEAPKKFTFSGAESRVNDSDLESISEECSEGHASSEDQKVIEELKTELKTLNEKQESLSIELKASTSRSSIKINSLRFCLILMKHQQQKALQNLKDSIESSLKTWTQNHVSSSLSSYTKKISEDTEKALEDSKKIIENSQVLEMLIKNTTSEFGSFLSGKKRENSDTKLEISRIYKKFELISKKQTVQAGVLEKIQDFMKQVNSQVPNELKVPGLAMNVVNTPKSQLALYDKGEILNTEKDSLELESPSAKSNFSYSRSQTPELPNIYRARP